MGVSRYGSIRIQGLAGLFIALLAVVPNTGVLARAVTVRLGDNHRMAVDYLMRQHQVSRQTAGRLMRQYEVKNGNRILDTLELPEGAQLDFYTVRNHEDPRKRVEFQGRGMLVDARSYLGRNTKNTLRSLLNTSERSGATQLLHQARDNGFMIVPVSMGGRPGGPVGTAAAQTLTIGVICPEFPHWNDLQPSGSGTVNVQSGTYYQANVQNLPGVKKYPLRPGNGNDSGWGPGGAGIHNPAWEDSSWDREFYADSPGGPINTNGIPLGLQANDSAWTAGGVTSTTNADHPRYGGDVRGGSLFAESPVQLRQRLYDLFFNKGLSSSLYTWFYQNSHAHVSVEGSPSSIMGWVDDHHILDRMPRGGSNYYSVQPGTPFLRPQDPAGPGIVRASLWTNGSANGLTLFFRRDVNSLSLSDLELWVYQTQDGDTKTAGTQAGWREILLNVSGSANRYADPWDHRRWTITDADWRFRDLNPDDPQPKYIGYAMARGQDWWCEVSNHNAQLGADPARWDSGSTGHRDQGMGCGAFPDYSPLPGVDLPTTIFYTGDTVIPSTGDGVAAPDGRVGSAAGNRLLSFCYYSHHGSYGNPLFATFSSSGSAYQLRTLRNTNGDTDPIAGTVDDPRDRVPRLYPFDHDVRDHDRPNMGGYFGTSNSFHTDSNCWNDVFQVMRDQGITYTNYDQLIFMYPGPTQLGETTDSSFIAHSGNPIPVSTGVGVTLLAHEICHNFGTDDLYDVDFYANNASPRPSPLYFESLMMTPYSVMAHGGFRLDPYHKLDVGWATSTNVVRNLGFTTISQVEQTTRDPVILKLPAHPLAVYADKNPAAPVGYSGGQAAWDGLKNPGSWQEYFLVENRNVTTGVYAGDKSPHGMYIFHVDLRIGAPQTGQRKEAWHSVALVQADGRNDLETYADGYPQTADMLDGDPYPGLESNRYLTERSQRLGNGRNSPTSWSYGTPDSGGSTIRPDTPTDSFVRITNITGPLSGPGGTPNAAGDPMTAFVYVEPAEVVVTGSSLIPAATPPAAYHQVQQGTTDLPVMILTLDNNSTYPNLSTDPVTINTIRVYEVGTSLNDGNIAVAKLYEDTNGNNTLEVGTDTLLKTATVSGDYIDFTNLGYTLALGAIKDVIVAYDIAEDAETIPTVTIGAELTEHTFISPTLPGAVQQRIRLNPGDAGVEVAGGDGYTFGDYRFPILSRTAMIVESPDTLTVTSEDLAPASALQGDADVPMLKLMLSVNHDEVTITGVDVDPIGVDIVGGVDVSVARVYHDVNGDGVINATEPLLGEAAITGTGPTATASITGLSFTVNSTATSYLILAVNITDSANVGRQVQFEVSNGAITLGSNPIDPHVDLVDYTNFPHTSSPTTITVANREPYPPPTASAPIDYKAQWVPADGAKTAITMPDCTFPRARDLAADPPGVPDPDPTDTAGTISYEAEFSQDQFVTVDHTQIIPADPAGPDTMSFTVSTALAAGTWYWRVRAIDMAGAQSEWSAPALTFQIVSAPQPPTSLSTNPAPIGGEIFTILPNYVWTLGSDAETPANQLITRLEVDDNFDFTSPLFTEDIPNGATSYLTPNDAGHRLTVGIHYYARALTVDGDGMESAWSTPAFEYTVVSNTAPNPPTGGFLANGVACGPTVEITTAVPTLEWNAATDPDNSAAELRYYIELDKDEDWGDGVNLVAALSPTAYDTTQVTVVNALEDNTQYFFRVQTEDIDGLKSSWSVVQTFWVNLGNEPPAKPWNGLAPKGDIRLNTRVATLECAAVSDPDPFDPDPPNVYLTYEFQLRADDDAFGPDPGAYDFRYTTLGTGTPVTVTTEALTGNKWRWRVRALDDQGLAGPWCNVQGFRINQAPNPPKNPASAWTPDGTLVSGTTLTFPKGSDPDAYEGDSSDTLAYIVELSNDNFVTVARTINIPADPADPDTISFTVPPPTLASGNWWWRVQTVDDGGDVSEYSAVHTFIVDNPPTPPTAPFSPSGVTITTRQPTFTWTIGTDPDPGDPTSTLVTIIELDDSPDFTAPLVLQATTNPGANSFLCTIVLRPGVRYYWRARTRDDDGMESANCADQWFDVEDNTAPSAPDWRTFDPRGGIEVTKANPLITWNASFDPDNSAAELHYILEMDMDDDWADGVNLLAWAADSNVTADGETQFLVSGYDCLDNVQYYYRIRAVDPDAQMSDWSLPTQDFWCNLVNEAPEAPNSGFNPVNGEQVPDQHPYLQCYQANDPDPSDKTSWNVAPTAWPVNALTYIFQLRPGDGDWALGHSYQYTVLGNSDRTRVGVRVPPGDTLTDLTMWYWRVRTVDDQGMTSPWSDTQYFFVDTGNQLPSLRAPGGDYTLALAPKYGRLATSFSFHVMYRDAEGDAPTDGVFVEIDNDPALRWPMNSTNPTAGPAQYSSTNGVEFVINILGSDIGYGGHTFRFLTSSDMVKWPTATDVPEAKQGPIIGSMSAIRLTDGAAPPADVTNYEEGTTVYVELDDEDANTDPAAIDSVTVGLIGLNDSARPDSESLVLTETGVDTHTFRGSIPMLGALGAVGDGTLNIIAGSTGDSVTATYTDPDCGGDCPPGEMDASSITATVTDTIPPTEAQSLLVAASGPEGRTIQLNWSTYTETTATQVDVAGYEVYVKEVDPADPDPLSTAGLTPWTVIPAGTLSAIVKDRVPNTTYWLAVVPIDERPNGADVDCIKVPTADTQAPTLAGMNPAHDLKEVPLDANIVFHVLDAGSGVDDGAATFHVYVNGVEVTADLVRSGGIYDRRFEYDPPADFGWNETITVRVVCDDFAGNHLDSETLVPPLYTFTARSDVAGPRITQLIPGVGAKNVPVSTGIGFHIEDDISGVNTATPASLVIQKDGVDITADCTIDETNPNDVIVTYTPPAPLPWDTGVDMSVGVADFAGNRTTPDPFTWHFDTQPDDEPPTISNIIPAPDATGVPIDTTISFRLNDPKSGVDESTLEVYLDGALLPAGDLTITGTPNALNVSYTPPASFAYEANVIVRVVVYDFAGNMILDENGLLDDGYEWTFQCEPAPRYRISGKITDQDGADLPGVLVIAYENGGGPGPEAGRAVSDGTGSYIISNLLAGEYRLVPQLDEYDFAPTEALLTIVDHDETDINFLGTLRTYTISGRVTESGVGATAVTGKAGVRVSDADGKYTDITDADGYYALTDVPSGRYTITPALQYYDFRPTSRTVLLVGVDVADVDFEAVAQTFTVAGTVRDYDGARVQGVRVTDGTHSAITNEAGQYTLSDIRAGTVTVSASKAGYIITPEDQQATVPPDATGVDFVAYLSFATSLPGGVNFISVPCYPADNDPTAVFGPFATVARWNPSGTPAEYVTLGSSSGRDVLTVIPGRGFFVNLPAGQLEVAGRPVSTTRPFTLTLGPVWNMVASMYQTVLPFGNFIPGVPGSIRPYGYVYDAVSGSYLLIAATPGINVARTVVYPWEGIWLRTSGGPASVSVTPPAATTAVDEAAPQALDIGSAGWVIPIAAQAGDRQDVTTAVGIAPALSASVELENPPMAPRTVDVYICSADGKHLSQEIRAGAASSATWEFKVVTDLPDAAVQVSLPDLSHVPNELSVYLTDLDSGKRVYARTMSAYTFRSGEAGGSCSFRLEVAPRTEAGLVITSAAAAQAAAGVAVTYGVSRDCNVSVSITNIAGRTIRTVCDGKATSKGINTLAWDMKSQSGTAAPNGRYLFRIEAVSEDGQRVQAVTTAIVQR